MSYSGANTVHYTGRFMRRIFHSDETGYCIYLYQNRGEATTVLGTDLPEVDYNITFSGRWVNSPRHGKQFQADIVIEPLPKAAKEIPVFVGKLGVGISKQKASAMVRLVGAEHFWEILQKDPERFSDIVSPNRLAKLQKKVKEKTILQAIVAVCGADLKIDTLRFKQICRVFKEQIQDLEKLIPQNPFILIHAGIPFQELDVFRAKRTSIPLNDNSRLLAAAQQALLDAQSQCHAGASLSVMLDSMMELMRPCGRVSRNECEDFLSHAVSRKQIAKCGELYYLNRSYEEESALVEILTALNCRPSRNLEKSRFEKKIKSYEKKKGFSLSADQKNAVWTALNRSVCVITGGPGTGKSTILDAIQVCWESFYPEEKCALLAPTGRAAVRMTEVTGLPASTIHSALRLEIDNISLERMAADPVPLNHELVIVDECSMIDQSTASSLVRALESIRTGNRQHLILVGDPDQLPSVGYGNILADIIASKVIPVCSLSTVYRQAEGNPIITNSMRMRDGNAQLDWTPSFKGFNQGSEKDNSVAAAKFYLRCVKQFGIENVALLTPYTGLQHQISTTAMNQQLQDMINPDTGQPSMASGKWVFRLHDRVMNLKNTDTLSNGDIGTITGVSSGSDDSEAFLTVTFESGIEENFTKENLFHLDLAYAISIHKAQGSQYETVIMMLPDVYSSFLKRNLVYTGITRSSQNVAIFGPAPVLIKAIENGEPEVRTTGLVQRLQKAL